MIVKPKFTEMRMTATAAAADYEASMEAIGVGGAADNDLGFNLINSTAAPNVTCPETNPALLSEVRDVW